MLDCTRKGAVQIPIVEGEEYLLACKGGLQLLDRTIQKRSLGFFGYDPCKKG